MLNSKLIEINQILCAHVYDAIYLTSANLKSSSFNLFGFNSPLLGAKVGKSQQLEERSSNESHQ